jgi:hypothetical protein
MMIGPALRKLPVLLILAFLPVLALAIDVPAGTFRIPFQSEGQYPSEGLVSLGALLVYAGMFALARKLAFRGRWSLTAAILALLFTGFTVIGLCFSAVDGLGMAVSSPLTTGLAILGYWVGYYYLTRAAIGLLDGKVRRPAPPVAWPRFVEKHLFWVCMAVMLLGWLPFIIIYYPGLFTYDAFYQWFQYFGEIPASNRAPYLTTLALGTLYSVGAAISPTLGTFTIMLPQVLYCSAVAAGVSCGIRRLGAGIGAALGSAVYFAVLPVWGDYAVSIIKDTAYYPTFALGVVNCALLQRKERLGWLDVAKVLAIGVVLCSIRNDGVYVYVAMLLATAVCRAGARRWLLAVCAAAVFAGSAGFNSVGLALLNVTPGSKGEMMSIPFQQTARYVKFFPDEVTEEEKAAINEVMEYSLLAELYHPGLSDRVRFTRGVEYAPSDEAMADYLRTWAEMGLKHPAVYLSATVANTYGYFYPFQTFEIRYSYTIETFPEKWEAKGIEGTYYHPTIEHWTSEETRWWTAKYLNTWRGIPVLSTLLNPGAYAWFLIFLVACLIRGRNWRNLGPLVGPAMVLAVCIASPVNGYTRYAMPIMACAPALLAWTLVALREARSSARDPLGELDQPAR